MSSLRVTPAMKRAAALALALRRAGFEGGTATGWRRARQLVRSAHLDSHTVRVMRAWFARHRHTSYPGYRKWVRAGRPTRPASPAERRAYRGAVAWLLWGGSDAERAVRAHARHAS